MTELKKPKRPVEPVDVRGEGEPEIRMAWSDGHESVHGARRLRGSCMCAGCVREGTGERVVGPDDVAEDVTARRFEHVGNYAIRIWWSDGHNTGLYPYRRLRELCECDACTGGPSAEGPTGDAAPDGGDAAPDG